MFRTSASSSAPSSAFPHACGDVPEGREGRDPPRPFSPRLWGCSADLQRRRGRRPLFPTPVGMFRRSRASRRNGRPFPHACGDVPRYLMCEVRPSTFSPRLWGCSASPDGPRPRGRLFPTPVGMFRLSSSSSWSSRTFPHACGDVPRIGTDGHGVIPFSPRLWGCSGRSRQCAASFALFPTPVGMFREVSEISISTSTFPHACGDVPTVISAIRTTLHFSPRLWGCSGSTASFRKMHLLFPTPVGMFRPPATR